MSVGDISYNSAELTVDISGKGLFDFSAVVLNVDCQPRQLTVESQTTVTIVHDKVYIVLTVVFGSLFVLCLSGVIVFLCCYWKRLQWRAKEQMT
jgi:hypothetical protein